MGRVSRKRKRNKKRAIDDDVKELLEFMKYNGWVNFSRLRVKNYPMTGRGLYSVKPIKEDQEIIQIPVNLLLSLNAIENDVCFIQNVKAYVKEDKNLNFQCLLSLYICYLIHINDSFWKSYIRTLPVSFSNPYFCNKAELVCLDVNILAKIKKQNEKIMSSFTTFSKLDYLQLDLFKWAFFVTNTRGSFMPTDHLIQTGYFADKLTDAPSIVLAPLLDSFNHSDRAKSFIKVTKSSYSLINSMDNTKYEQIFINYGAHNNEKLLLDYGFFIKDNQDDFIEVTITDIITLFRVDPELRAIRIPKPTFNFIKEHNLDDLMFFDKTEGMSHNLVAVLMLIYTEKNIKNFNLIAFGNFVDIQLVKNIGNKLLKLKISEFTNCTNQLSNTINSSCAGQMCASFYKECVQYLNNCLEVLENL